MVIKYSILESELIGRDLIIMMIAGTSETRPHHLHERGNIVAQSSPMIGDPNKDIQKLVKYVRKKKMEEI